MVTAAAALIGASLGVLVAAVAIPRRRTVVRRWRAAASMFDLPPSGPLVATLTERQADGWNETRKQTVVFLDKLETPDGGGDGYQALSATCTHLGCRVAWNADELHYKCPCHGGVFDRQGHVVSGPPPRGLERLSVRVNPETAELEVEL